MGGNVPIKFSCPKCGKPISCDDSVAGSAGTRCAACGTVAMRPSAPAPPSPRGPARIPTPPKGVPAADAPPVPKGTGDMSHAIAGLLPGLPILLQGGAVDVSDAQAWNYVDGLDRKVKCPGCGHAFSAREVFLLLFGQRMTGGGQFAESELASLAPLIHSHRCHKCAPPQPRKGDDCYFCCKRASHPSARYSVTLPSSSGTRPGVLGIARCQTCQRNHQASDRARSQGCLGVIGIVTLAIIIEPAVFRGLMSWGAPADSRSTGGALWSFSILLSYLSIPAALYAVVKLSGILLDRLEERESRSARHDGTNPLHTWKEHPEYLRAIEGQPTAAAAARLTGRKTFKCSHCGAVCVKEPERQLTFELMLARGSRISGAERCGQCGQLMAIEDIYRGKYDC